jgi:hypothetical protein
LPTTWSRTCPKCARSWRGKSKPPRGRAAQPAHAADRPERRRTPFGRGPP